MASRPSILTRIKNGIIIYALLTFAVCAVYYETWGKHVYIVTAYCNCAICVNIPKYRDGQFASGRQEYWGGIAADPSVPFGSEVELLPHAPADWFAVLGLLKGRRHFIVEDRGGKIKGRHIDLYFSDKRGGHKAALQWGVRRMRLKINGKLAD